MSLAALLKFENEIKNIESYVLFNPTKKPNYKNKQQKLIIRYYSGGIYEFLKLPIFFSQFQANYH